MARYECMVCGYVHDESQEGASWESLPDGWTCPVCGAARDQFRAVGGEAPAAAEADGPAPGGWGLPARVVVAHRVFGYVFLALFVVLVVQMIPRLWTYQIEFPARTVLHIALGMAVGTMLLVKIAIVRFFRRLDPALVPALGTSVLVASVVLIGISVPAAFQEAMATARLFNEDNRDRVGELLVQTGLDEAECTRLSSAESLRAGQRVLRNECIGCHDLRTVLARPRTPSNWRQTVARMADRTTMLNPLEESEQWQVTAYLIAVSPQLWKSARQRSEEEAQRDESVEAAQAVAQEEVEAPAYDAAAARKLFEAKCSQCHQVAAVADAPPGSETEARELISWMVDEGLEASEEELALLVRYLTETYAQPKE